MSSTPIISDAASPQARPIAAPHERPLAELLVCLPAIPPEALTAAFEAVVSAFPNESVFVACCDQSFDVTGWPSIELIPYTSARTDIDWVLAAGDYAAASHLAVDRNTRLVILLGDDTAAIDPLMLRAMADCIRTKNVDLVVPRFKLGPNDGLVTSALLYPLSRALFGADIRFPLCADAALSNRMAHRLLSSTQRLVSVNQGSSLLWPVAEAAIAGFSVRQIVAGDVPPPTPPNEDFNVLFSGVAGSLFADIDAKATFWQRARGLPVRPPIRNSPPATPTTAPSPEIQSMIESFHLAQANLQEIWSLVLPPQSRLALKKLSQASPDAFFIEPDLWARIVYDFALAFHLRTLNRNHLLGALTPLYLAWVASYLLTTADDPERAVHALELTASAFETEKSYIVSRWRWPDRFNP